MVKKALLVGVSQYGQGLTPIPSATKDVEAMQHVLEDAEIGQFDEVKTLTNPDPLAMQRAIETLFADRNKDDLVLLFFSGHGIKDTSNRLYFATTITCKTQSGELVKSTAVPANFVLDVMSNSRSKRQVILLDCCFSGAFAEGMAAKDDGSVNVQTQLGGEGRAVLTSTNYTQYAFESQQDESNLSVYTRYLVEGLKTGAADVNRSGEISIDELHEYACRKVKESTPAMEPQIYTVKQGFRIVLAKAPVDDPQLNYRRYVEVEVRAFPDKSKIQDVSRRILDTRRKELNISLREAQEIEAEVLKPHQEYRQKLQEYEEELTKALKRETPLNLQMRQSLKRFQAVLGLEDKDVKSIEARLISPKEAQQTVSDSHQGLQPTSPSPAPVQPQNCEERIDQSQRITNGLAKSTPFLNTVPVSQSESAVQPHAVVSEVKSTETGLLTSRTSRRRMLLGSTALGFALIWGGYSSQSFGIIVFGLLSIVISATCVWISGRALRVAPWRNHFIVKALFWLSFCLLVIASLIAYVLGNAYDSFSVWNVGYNPDGVASQAVQWFRFAIPALFVYLSSTFIGRW